MFSKNRYQELSPENRRAVDRLCKLGDEAIAGMAQLMPVSSAVEIEKYCDNWERAHRQGDDTMDRVNLIQQIEALLETADYTTLRQIYVFVNGITA